MSSASDWPRLTTVKLALTFVGLATFGIGVRIDQPAVRWAGIALVAVAFVLRFSRRRSDGDDQLPPDTR